MELLVMVFIITQGLTTPSFEASIEDDNSPPSQIVDLTLDKGSLKNKHDYGATCQLIKTQKMSLGAQLKRNNVQRDSLLSSAGFLLEQSLTRDIIPYWYGTEWDYNGITTTPGEGQIACGYFISTTLKQIGFNLNRYRVAQGAASDIIKSFCHDTLINTTYNVPDLVKYAKSQPDAIYVLGLSYHVGFLHKTGDKVYFLHSNFGFPFGVIREEAEGSPALDGSTIFMLGNLSRNPELLRRWLGNEFITAKRSS